VIVCVALLAVCLAQDVPTAAAKINYLPQEKVLSHDAVGNFACRVDSVEVTMDVAGDEDKMVVSAQDLEESLSQTATLEWAHVNQFFFASVDGRNDEKSLSTGGGDLGEFIQALDAYTKVTGVVLTAEEVNEALTRHLKIMSRSKFFYQTDEKAYKKLAIATGCQNLQIAGLAEKRKRQNVLDKFADPEMAEFIGDPFLKFLASSEETAQTTRSYITAGIQAFHTNMWKTHSDSDKVCYMETKGRFDPKAIIHVRTPSYCVDQGLAPLISPAMCSGQALIDFPDAVKLYRRELVQLLAKPGDNPQDILAEFNSIAQENLNRYYESLVGIPVFSVTFKNSSPFLQAGGEAEVEI